MPNRVVIRLCHPDQAERWNMTKTKIKNALLAAMGIPLAIIMAGEVQKPEYWWIQALAAVGVYVIIKISIGGNNDGRD